MSGKIFTPPEIRHFSAQPYCIPTCACGLLASVIPGPFCGAVVISTAPWYCGWGLRCGCRGRYFGVPRVRLLKSAGGGWIGGWRLARACLAWRILDSITARPRPVPSRALRVREAYLDEIALRARWRERVHGGVNRAERLFDSWTHFFRLRAFRVAWAGGTSSLLKRRLILIPNA